MSQLKGHISQVIGPVVDVYFEGKNIDEAFRNLFRVVLNAVSKLLSVIGPVPA